MDLREKRVQTARPPKEYFGGLFFKEVACSKIIRSIQVRTAHQKYKGEYFYA
jgi:hypothetical protein